MSYNLVNAGITIAVILFITFPANIFNQTFSSNYGEILIMFGNGRRRIRRFFGLKPKVSTDDEVTSESAGTAMAVVDAPDRSSRFWFYSVLAVGAVLGGLLNPRFGRNRQSADGFVATLLAFTFGAIVRGRSKDLPHPTPLPVGRLLRALPLGLAVAALCVRFLPSRTFNRAISTASSCPWRSSKRWRSVTTLT